MASIIRIKRSSTSGNPSTLGAGELAYSALTDNGSNGGDRLYIGMGTETSGNAVNHVVIGGKYFTDMLDQTPGVLTASSALVVDSSKKLDELLVDNLSLNGNTLSSTDTNGNLLLTPNGTGKTVVTNLYIGDTSTPLSEYIYDTVGGAVTGGTGITVTNNDGSNTSTVAIDSTVATLTGSQTLTNKTLTAPIIATISNTGTLTLPSSTDTLVGRATTDTLTNKTLTAPIISTISNTGTLTLPTATDTLVGRATSDTLTNKSISGSTNTLSNIGNSSLTNSSVTIGSTTIALGATSTGLSGVTQLNVDNIRIDGNTISSTDTNGNIILDPNGTGVIDMSGARVTNLAEPTSDSDAATKYYVDAARSGLDVKSSVKVATTANITLSNTQTIDGIALSVGDRVLVKDQSTGADNGIYVVASGSWTRATDFDAPAEVTSGVFTFVEQGTVNGDCGFVLTTDGTVTVGTTALAFTLFSSSGTLIAGNGLSKNGYTLEVNVANGIEVSADNVQLASTVAGAGMTYTSGVLNVIGTSNRVTVNADSIDIASTYVGQSSITTLGTIGTGTWQGDIVSPTYGGTGVNNGSKTITLGGNFTTSGAYSTTLTATATTSVTLPTTGTLATLAGTESLSNKTITASSFAGSVAATTISASGLVTLNNTTDAGPLGTAAVVLAGGLSVTKQIYVGTNITGAGAATSTLDGFNIDGGTY